MTRRWNLRDPLWLAALVSTLATGGAGPRAATAAAAVGRAGPATPDANRQELPDWIRVNREAGEVKLVVVAGKTDFNHRWNFNGYANGDATITVPQGYRVTLDFRNDDPAVPHSLGIGEREERYPPIFENPTPAFEGAFTSSPTSVTESTLPGEQETIAFTASRAGEYAMICYVPAHAATGMWIHFRVSADGEVGFEVSGP